MGDAIEALVQICEPMALSALEEIVDKQVEAAPLVSMIGSSAVDRQGQVVATRGSLISDDSTEHDFARRASMLDQARIFQGGQVYAHIDPARSRIVEEHSVDEVVLANHLATSPVISEDRVTLIARGLAAGFRGDWPSACSLLIPQVEEAVRLLLRRVGDITSTLDDCSVQKQQDLKSLLCRDKLKELLGESLVFHLQGLLVAQHGSNIRNRMAHGLMNESDFEDPTVEYCWWIALCFFWPTSWGERRPAPDAGFTTPES